MAKEVLASAEARSRLPQLSDELVAHPEQTIEVGRQRRREVVVLAAGRYDEMLEREDLVRDLAWVAFAQERIEHPQRAAQLGGRPASSANCSLMARIVVEFLDDAAFESVERLPEPHREIAWELLDHLREQPRYGKPLEARPETSELQATRSLYVIDFAQQRVSWPPPYRIVYRLLPSERQLEKAQVIWAGRRDALFVDRLGSSTDESRSPRWPASLTTPDFAQNSVTPPI